MYVYGHRTRVSKGFTVVTIIILSYDRNDLDYSVVGPMSYNFPSRSSTSYAPVFEFNWFFFVRRRRDEGGGRGNKDKTEHNLYFDFALFKRNQTISTHVFSFDKIPKN